MSALAGPPWLGLLRAEASTAEREAAVASLARLPAEDTLATLQRHRLDQLVLRAVLDGGFEDLLGGDLVEALRTRRRRAAVELMLRQEAAERATRALGDLPHVVFKGMVLGQLLYGDPLLRPSVDVDLLVAEGDRHYAHTALLEAGFALAPQADQPPYEVAYFGHGAHLDLHWHPLAPSRSRVPLGPELLAGRQLNDGLWQPAPEGNALVLLLNPALTDHVTERLIQALDLDRFLRQQPCDWPRVVEILHRAGLRTAAWAMLEHTRRHFGSPVERAVDPLDKRLAPSRWRRRAIRRWLRSDPASLYRRHPLLVRAGFGTLLHDSLPHGLRALAAAVTERRAARRGPSIEPR